MDGYRTVRELSREELEELKSCYYMEKMDDLGEKVYYSDLADVDELVTDEEVFEHYSHISFVDDDFFCNQ